MSGQNGALAAASDRLRDVLGFPKRPGRPRKISTTGLKVDVPQRRQRVARGVPLRDPSQTDDGLSAVPQENRTSSPALPPRLLGARDGGAYLGVSAWGLRELVDKGHLRRVALPGINRLLVDRADLDALIEKGKGAR
jgi:hypothetical protein